MAFKAACWVMQALEVSEGSVILSNNCVSLLSALCTVYRWRNWHCKWSHSSSLHIDVSWTKDSLQIYAPELWKWLLHIMCNGGLKLDVLCWTRVKHLIWLIMDIHLTCCCNVNAHIRYYVSWFSGTLNNAFKSDGAAPFLLPLLPLRLQMVYGRVGYCRQSCLLYTLMSLCSKCWVLV